MNSEKSKLDLSGAQTKLAPDKAVFNVYGTEHNVWMDSIAAAPSFSTLFDEDLFDEAQTFNSSVFGQSSLTWSDFQTVESYAHTLLNLTPVNARILLVSTDSMFDSSMSPALEMLFDITGTSRNLTDYQTKIADLEDYLLDNYSADYDSVKLEGNAAALLLGACAVARNSGNYWNYAENNSASPWHGRISGMDAPDPNSPSPHYRLPRWLRAAVVDVGSFVSCRNCVHYPTYQEPWYSYDLLGAWDYAGNGSSQVQ